MNSHAMQVNEIDRNWARIEETILDIVSKRGVRPDEQGYRPAIDFARLTVSKMTMQQQESTTRAMLAMLQLNGDRAFGEMLRPNGDKVYGEVDLPRSTSPDRQQILEEISARLACRGARHLEMGVHIGFPESRVRSLIEERKLGEFLRLDMDAEVRPDVVADCARLPFLDGSLDSVGSDSLFEHMRFPHDTIRESFRVLAPGGVMQINMPFFFTIHNYPGDYMRLTPQFLEETCKEVGFERVYCHVHDFGGLYYTMHNSSKQVLINDTLDASVVDSARSMHSNVTTLLMLASAFDPFFYGEARNFFFCVYCAAFKAGQPEPRDSGRHSAEGSVLDRMLPYLACPMTHQPLLRVAPDTLVTSDRRFVYTVRDGIPLLVPKFSVFANWKNEQAELRELREFREIILASGSYRLARRISAFMRASRLKALSGAVPKRVKSLILGG